MTRSEGRGDNEEGLQNISEAFSQRSQILQTKLGILAAQVLDRLRLQSENLSSILEQEQELADRILNRSHYEEGSPALDQLRQQRGFLKQEQRNQKVDSWRDLSHVIRDLLSTWEDLEQTKTRDRLLSDPTPINPPPSDQQSVPIPDYNLNRNYYD